MPSTMLGLKPPIISQRNAFRILAILGALFALYFIGIYLYIAIKRIGFPFELEWMEGGMVDHVQRVLSGAKLYSEPSPDFVAFIYPPVYFYLSAAVSKILSLGYLPLRLVSLLSSEGLFLLLLVWIRKETGKLFYGIISAGFYAATFELSGSWFDIGRIDSLYLLILMLGLYMIRFGRGNYSAITAGIFFTLAWLTKQTALAAIPAAALCLWLVQPKRCFFFVLSSALASGISFLALNQYYNGWFAYYLFDVPRHHVIYTHLFTHFWRYDLIGPAAIACSFSFIFFILNMRERNLFKKVFYILIPLMLFAIAAISRVHSEAFSNVLFPAYAALALMMPLALKHILSDRTFAGPLRLGPTMGLIFLLAQFYQLHYPIERHIPSAYDTAAGNRLVKNIQAVAGDVLIPYHGYLTTQAGKSVGAHAMGVYDVLRSPDHAGARLIAAYQKRIESRKYEAIVLDDSESFLTYSQQIKQLYGKRIKLFNLNHILRPRTGSYFRPVHIVFLKGSESEKKVKDLLKQPIILLPNKQNHPH